MNIIFVIALLQSVLADPVVVKASKNEMTKQTLPGMIFLPAFIAVTILFIIFRTAFQAIYDRKKRPLNPQAVVDQMNFD